jgi:hypothetical protein
MAAVRKGVYMMKVAFGLLDAAVVLLAMQPFLATGAMASVVLTNGSFSSLQDAVQRGGSVKLDFDGTVALQQTLLVSSNVTLDATGHMVSLDGGGKVRHFFVTNSAALRLINLTLVNGSFIGADGQANQAGQIGWGGSIYNSGGALELMRCRFLSNQVAGGRGGPSAWRGRNGISLGILRFALHAPLCNFCDIHRDLNTRLNLRWVANLTRNPFNTFRAG